MVQILPPRQRAQSFLEMLGTGIGGAAKGFFEERDKQREDEMIRKYDPELAKVPREFREMAFQSKMKQQEQGSKFAQEMQRNQKKQRFLEEQAGVEPGTYEGLDPDFVHKVIQANKPKEEKPQPLSPAQKAVSQEIGKSYIAAKNEIPKLNDTLRNIQHLREIGKTQLSGLSGFIKSGLGTSSATEYNTLAGSLLDPIIKVFNPSGTLQVNKFNWIRDQYQPKSGELQTTQEGKLNTLERLANQAVKRNEEKIKLFNDFNGDPPESEILKFDNESEKILNDFIDQGMYVDKLKKETPEGKVLLLDPNGKPLQVDPNEKLPNGMTAIEFILSNGGKLVE